METKNYQKMSMMGTYYNKLHAIQMQKWFPNEAHIKT